MSRVALRCFHCATVMGVAEKFDCEIGTKCCVSDPAYAPRHEQHNRNSAGDEHNNHMHYHASRAISSEQRDVHTESEHCSASDSYVTDEHRANNREDATAATWIMATGACYHCTGNRDLLSEFTPEHGRFVQAGDGAPMQVCGRGTVNTVSVVLPDVLFVPGLTANLVSASQLTELDFCVVFNRGLCDIINGTDGRIVGKAHTRADGFFELDFLHVPLTM